MRPAASAIELPATGDVSAGVPAFGALSSQARDNVYWFGSRGVMYTSPWVVTPCTERQSAVLLVTASGRPVTLGVAGRALRCEAVVIAPRVRRALAAVDVGLVSVNIQPHHPAFRAFCRIAPPGLAALDRRAFTRFDADLVRAYEGRLALPAAERLFEGLVETTAARLDAPMRPDARAELLRAILREHPDCSLDELARTLDVSYTSASHAFSRAMGVPFRTYQHWRKCMKANEWLGGELKLTEIAQRAGFADQAHLSRAWQSRYGMAPSYLRNRNHVRIFD